MGFEPTIGPVSWTEFPAGAILPARYTRMASHESCLYRTDGTAREYQGRRPAQARARPGQVLVKVRAVSLNPIDLYIRSGMVAFPLAFPYIIACDLAGTVEQVGPDCKRLEVGDRVWGIEPGAPGTPGSGLRVRGGR